MGCFPVPIAALSFHLCVNNVNLLSHPSFPFLSPPLRRWLTVPFAFTVQLSIGSVYAWSTFNAPLTRQLGVVVPAADDWGLVRQPNPL